MSAFAILLPAFFDEQRFSSRRSHVVLLKSANSEYFRVLALQERTEKSLQKTIEFWRKRAPYFFRAAEHLGFFHPLVRSREPALAECYPDLVNLLIRNDLLSV